MRKFINWLVSLFAKKEVAKQSVSCTLLPDPRRPLSARRVKPRPTPTPTPTPVSSVLHCLYFNFKGANVTNYQWNNGVAFYSAPSTMLVEDQKQALYAVQAAYAKYKLVVTDDPAVYLAHVGSKQEIIVTPTSSWAFSGFSGIAYVGSFGTDTPGFVFEDRLYSRWDYVGDIMIHESGHTLGLLHQSLYDNACTLVSAYKRGCHMGSPFDTDAAWITGTTQSCRTFQNDDALLQNKLGLK